MWIGFKPARQRVAFAQYYPVLELIMEITRQPVVNFSPSTERPVSGTTERASSGPVAPVSAPAAIKPGLEQIHSALGQLPQVNLDKVAALKAALAAGELTSDSASLASAMLTYHRGDR